MKDMTDIDNLERKEKKINKKRIISIIIDIILVGIILFCLYKIGIWFFDNYKSSQVKDKYKKIQEKIDNIDISKNIEDTKTITELKKQNPDTFGWLKVKNTKINYPIVKSNDNDYYLNHSFDKTYNSAGWPFIDYKNKLDGTDKNIVIYGHNRKNGDMFGTLDEVLKEDWYSNKDNKEIIFITEKEIQRYEVFSVYEVLNEEYYINTEFNSDTYSNFINTIFKRSIYNFETKIDYNKNVLTLSTCSNNDKYRTVLHAIKK